MGTASDDDAPQEGLRTGLLHGLQFPVQPGLGATLMRTDVPTFAPPMVGHIAALRAAGPDDPDPGAALNEAMRRDALRNSTARPDLGLVGNLSRAALHGDFSKDLFENYWQGKGPMQLSDDRFQDIVEAAAMKPRPQGTKDVQVISVNGNPLVRRQFKLYGDDKYTDSLGTVSLFYAADGKPAGLYDKYDFDCNFRKDRPLRATLETCAMKNLGPYFGAKEFPLYYGDYAPIK